MLYIHSNDSLNIIDVGWLGGKWGGESATRIRFCSAHFPRMLFFPGYISRDYESCVHAVAADFNVISLNGVQRILWPIKYIAAVNFKLCSAKTKCPRPNFKRWNLVSLFSLNFSLVEEILNAAYLHVCICVLFNKSETVLICISQFNPID